MYKGKRLMSEMSHVMTFLQSMGYDTNGLTIDQVMTIKEAMLNSIEHDRNILNVKDAFQ